MLKLGKLADSYRLTDQSAGAGEYIATHARMRKRSFVVKEFRRLSRDDTRLNDDVFQCAVDALTDLSHSCILHVYDCATTDDAYLLVVENVEGDTLDDLLTNTPLPPERAFAIVSQLADALEAAHGQGHIHRYLKPADVRIRITGNDCRVKLGGFEAAAMAASRHDDWGSGETPGDPRYQAPEQLEGAQATVQSDVYALGVLCYQMLTGRLPFEGDGFFALRYAKRCDATLPDDMQTRRLLPAARKLVLNLALKMLRYEPKKRFANMAEVRDALARLRPAEPCPEDGPRRVIVECYPHPIAAAYRGAWLDPSWRSRYLKLTKLFEITLRYWTAAAINGLLDATGHALPLKDLVVKAASNGTWRDHLGFAVNLLSGQSGLMGELRSAYCDKCGGLPSGQEQVRFVIEARNNLSKGGVPNEWQSRRLFEELMPTVEGLLERLTFLTHYPLVYVHGVSYKKATNRNELRCSLLMGASLSDEEQKLEVDLKHRIEDGTLGMFDEANKGPLLDLGPFVTHRECPRCEGLRELFFYNKCAGEKLTCVKYVSYQKAHEMDDNRGVEVFRLRGFALPVDQATRVDHDEP